MWGGGFIPKKKKEKKREYLSGQGSQTYRKANKRTLERKEKNPHLVQMIHNRYNLGRVDTRLAKGSVQFLEIRRTGLPQRKNISPSRRRGIEGDASFFFWVFLAKADQTNSARMQMDRRAKHHFYYILFIHCSWAVSFIHISSTWKHMPSCKIRMV